MMRTAIPLLLYAGLLAVVSCQAQGDAGSARPEDAVASPPPRLLDEVFVSDTSRYAVAARAAFARLDDAERVAQLIMTTGGRLGRPYDSLAALVRDGVVGGAIFLAHPLDSHRAQVGRLRDLDGDGGAHVPLWFAIDAEPGLLAKRVVGGPSLPPAAEIRSAAGAARAATRTDSLLRDLGYHWNYAPVVDLGTENAAIRNRSFGASPKDVVERAVAYVDATQEGGVLACVKHFPGHGLVDGDTHKGSVYVRGELRELGVYEQILERCDPLSLMVGHITVEDNAYATDGLPASLSRRVTHDLIRDALGYPGIVVTDALNMMAAATKYGPEAPLLASRAGADVILMPADERATHAMLLAELRRDPAYREQLYRSVDRVLRAKAWLGLL